MLTLCVLNYNGNDSLRASIQSVLDQTHKPDRFVVIDNNSSDGSRQIAVDMGVEVVDADNRHKFITGLNKASDLNKDKLFFMQNDVVLDKFCLSEITGAIEGKYRFFIQPIIVDVEGKIDNAGMDYKWPGYGERRKSAWFKGYVYEPCGLVTTICFMTDLKPFWDTQFSPAYYEDIDMYLRTKALASHWICPRAKAIHRGNHTFSQSYKKLEISRICRKNRKKLIRKHYKGFDQWLRLAVTTCFDIVKEPIDIINNWWVPEHKFK